MSMTFEMFLSKYCGQKVDWDKAYGYQCTDLFRQYCHDVLDIPHTGAVDGAKELYEKYAKLPREKEFFIRLTKTAVPKYGYVAVFGSTPTNKYGHVALVVCKLSASSLLVFEQNGFTQDGAKFTERKMDNLLGYLKYRGE